MHNHLDGLMAHVADTLGGVRSHILRNVYAFYRIDGAFFTRMMSVLLGVLTLGSALSGMRKGYSEKKVDAEDRIDRAIAILNSNYDGPLSEELADEVESILLGRDERSLA